MAEDTKVKITVVADTDKAQEELKGVADQLNKTGKEATETQSKFSKFNSQLAEVGRKMQLVGRNLSLAISAPLAKIGKDIVVKGSQLAAFEETFSTSMKSMVGSATNFASKYASTVGMTTTQVRQQVLEFNKFAKAMGMGEQEAYKFSESMVKVTNDLAAYFDVDTVDAADRMKSALMGNYEAVDALGLAFGQSTIKQEMMKKGLKGEFSQLDESQKMWLLYGLAVKQGADSNGYAAKEAENFQGKMRELKGTLEEVYVKVFKVMEPSILNFIQELTDLAEKLDTLTAKQIKFLVELGKWSILLPPIILYLGWITEAFGYLSSAIKGFGTVWTVGKKFFTEYGQGFKTLDGTIYQVEKRFKMLKLAMVGVPKAPIWITAIVVALSILSLVVYKNWDTIKPVLENLGAKFKEVFGEVKAWVMPILQELVKNFQDLYSKVAPVVIAFAKEMGVWLSVYVPKAIKLLSDAFMKYLYPVLRPFIDLGLALAKTYISIVEVVWSFVKVILTLAGAVITAMAGIVGILLPVLLSIGKAFFSIVAIIVGIVVRIALALTPVIAKIIAIVLTVVALLVPVITTIGVVIAYLVNTFLIPALNIIGKVIAFLLNNLILPFIVTMFVIIETLANVVTWILEKVLIPILQGITNWLNKASSYFGNAIKNMIKWFANFYGAILNGYNENIQPFFTKIIEKIFNLKKQWGDVWENCKNVFKDFIKNILDMWDAMKGLKLPQIKVEGKFNLTPPDISFPKLSWFATGGIFTGPSVVGLGEQGDEAVLPLSNKSKMKPFAEAVANFMPDVKSGEIKTESEGVNINISSLVIREDADITKLAKEIVKLQEKKERARGGLSFNG